MERALVVAVAFDLRRRLGSGYFGEVWLAIDIGLNVECAVKIIPAAKIPDQNNFFRESQTLQAVEHQNVVKIRDTGHLDGDRIYLAMELLPKGSLEDEASGGYVPLTRAKRLIIDVLRGLEHAHAQGILHRDIKPANVLIGDNNEGKLSDFGLAMPAGIDLSKLGVKEYVYVLHRAPELNTGAQFSEQADIYACGVTLYRLVNGDEAVQRTPLAAVPALAAAGKFPDRAAYRDFVPRSLKTIINRGMNPDPARRYRSAEAMRRALEGCVVKVNWDVQSLPNGKRWRTGLEHRCIEVELLKLPDHTWSVTTRHGPSKHSLRRINKFCAERLSRREAERLARTILQSYVTGQT